MSMYMWMCVCKRGHRWQWAGPESKGWTYDSGRFWEEEGNPYYFAEWIQTWNIVHYVSGPQSFQHQGSFHGIQFFLRWSGLDGFRMIQAHYIYFVLYYYYISSTSGDQTLDPGGWGHLHYVENLKKMQNSRVFLQRFWVNWSSLQHQIFLKVAQVIVMWIQEWELLVEQIAFRVSKKWDSFSRAVISKRDLGAWAGQTQRSFHSPKDVTFILVKRARQLILCSWGMNWDVIARKHST